MTKIHFCLLIYPMSQPACNRYHWLRKKITENQALLEYRNLNLPTETPLKACEKSSVLGRATPILDAAGKQPQEGPASLTAVSQQSPLTASLPLTLKMLRPGLQRTANPGTDDLTAIFPQATRSPRRPARQCRQRVCAASSRPVSAALELGSEDA